MTKHLKSSEDFNQEIEKGRKLLSILDRLNNRIQYYSTEIGLQTYGRNPNQMLETQQYEKLNMAEKMVREMRKESKALMDEAIKIVESKYEINSRTK